jgi:hypothetical protein
MKCKNCAYFSKRPQDYWYMVISFGQCLCPEHEEYLKSIDFHGVLKVNENDSCKYYLAKNVKCEFKEII